METTPFIWMDGAFVRWEDAKVHVLTHTLHYGAGAFEGIRFYDTPKGPAVFRLKDHMKRLAYSCNTIAMKLPYSVEELCEATLELVRRNKVKSGYIRPIAYYGYGKMGLDPKGAPVHVAIACWPWGKYLGDHAVRVKTSRVMRIHPQSSVTDAKIVGHYVNSILASLEAHGKGYDEALFLDYRGAVAEGPGENLFIVKKGALYTPPLGTILAGITRDSVMRIARDLGYKVQEKTLKQNDLYAADEAFFTGTAAEVTPIASIDGKKIGKQAPGPVTTRVREIFLNMAGGGVARYKSWLSYSKLSK